MNDRKFLPFEFSQLKDLRNKTPVFSKSGEYSDEYVNYLWIKELIYSRIPKHYWKIGSYYKLQIDSDMKRVAKVFLENYQTALDNGLGLLFYGKNGRGKTSTSVSICIELMKRGISCTYITAQTFIDFEKDFENSENREIIMNRLNQSQVILMDEFDADKIYINEKTKYALKKLENYLREYLGSNKVMILCSNLNAEQLSTAFNASVSSLVRRNLKLVEFVGQDVSENRQNVWDSLMIGNKKKKKERDLYPVLSSDAQEWFANNRGEKNDSGK